jgi:Spy/CpxP family protein refolding chaperone
MKYLRKVVFGAMMIGAVAVASAHPGHERIHRSHFGGEPTFARLIEKLDLSDAQRQSIDSILEASKAQRQALRDQNREAMAASFNTLPDDPSYAALVEKRKQLASEAIQQRSDLNSQIYALLTPEQKARIPQLIEEAKAKMKQHRGGKHRKHSETQL